MKRRPIDDYNQQLDAKIARLTADFSGFDLPPIQVHASAPHHFRMRAEFRVWHEGTRSYYAMTPVGERKPAPIDGFPIGSIAMVDIMPPLMAAIENDALLRRKLYAIEFLTTRNGQVLVTMIYHKPLDADWQEKARALAKHLGIQLIGRSRKQKVVLDKDYVTESFTVNGRTLHYQQVETGFTQPNADVNEKMLNWANSVTCESNGDLLELYCGNGNFTLALAQNFNRVLATEVSKISVNSANYNILLNQIKNIKIVRMSSEEFTDALNGVRPFTRLKDIDLGSYQFSTLFVDPPRAGLDPDTLALASGFDRILYISCNPDTLKDNLTTLTQSHAIKAFAAFDQFPYTHHLECGVLLEKLTDVTA